MHRLRFSLVCVSIANAQLLDISLGAGVDLTTVVLPTALPTALPSDLLDISLGVGVSVSIPTALPSDLLALPTSLPSGLVPDITLPPLALPSELLPTQTLQLPVISLAASALLPTSFLGLSPTPVFYTCPEYDGQTIIENGLLYVLSCRGRATGDVFTSVPATASFNDCFTACDSASTLLGAKFCTGFTYIGGVSGLGAGTCELQNSVAQSIARDDGAGNVVSAVRVVNYLLGGNAFPLVSDLLPTQVSSISLPLVTEIIGAIPLPTLSLPALTLSTMSLPALSIPAISLPDISLPTGLPISIPSISLPGLSLPVTYLPSISLPTGLSLSIPAISLPALSLSVTPLPDVSIPTKLPISLPSLGLPSPTSALPSESLPVVSLPAISIVSTVSFPPSTSSVSSGPDQSLSLSVPSINASSASLPVSTPSATPAPASSIDPLSTPMPVTTPSPPPILMCPEANVRSYVSSSGRAYKIQCGTEYPSKTVSTSTQPDLMACIDSCSGVNGSVGVTYIGVTCSCKSSTTGGIRNALADSAALAALSCGPNDDDKSYIDSLGGEYQILCNLTFPQARIIRPLAKRAPGDIVPVISCSTQCTRLPGCIAATSMRGGQCTFISDLGPSIAAWKEGDTIVMAGKRIPTIDGAGSTIVSTSRPTIEIPSMTTTLPNLSTAPTGFMTVTTPAFCTSQITLVLPVTTVLTTATITSCSAQLGGQTTCSARHASSAAVTATVKPQPCLVNALGSCMAR